MAKVGEAELYTSASGWITVELYEPADLSYTPIEIYTPNGWGVPHVTSPADADTPLEVYTETNGWMGISTLGYVIIEDFEDATLDDAWLNSDTTAVYETSARAAFQGSYGVRLEDDATELIVADPTYSSTLDYYPEPGDQFDVYVKGDSSALSQSPEIWWGIQNPPDETNDAGDFTTGHVEDHYFVRWFMESDGDVNYNLSRDDSNTSVELDDYVATAESETTDPDKWYRINVDWHYSSSGVISVDFYEYDGPTVDDETHLGFTLSASDSTYGKGGIGFRGHGVFDADYWKKTAPL